MDWMRLADMVLSGTPVLDILVEVLAPHPANPRVWRKRGSGIYTFPFSVPPDRYTLYVRPTDFGAHDYEVGFSHNELGDGVLGNDTYRGLEVFRKVIGALLAFAGREPVQAFWFFAEEPGKKLEKTDSRRRRVYSTLGQRMEKMTLGVWKFYGRMQDGEYRLENTRFRAGRPETAPVAAGSSHEPQHAN